MKYDLLFAVGAFVAGYGGGLAQDGPMPIGWPLIAIGCALLLAAVVASIAAVVRETKRERAAKEAASGTGIRVVETTMREVER